MPDDVNTPEDLLSVEAPVPLPPADDPDSSDPEETQTHASGPGAVSPMEEPSVPLIVDPSPAPLAAYASSSEPEGVAAQTSSGVEEGDEEPPVDAPPPETPHEEQRKHWYVVKVQSGREDTIKEAIERRMRKEGLEEFFGQIVIPVEKVSEVKTDKNGKRVTRTKERKLYPGYLMVEVEYNDRILYLFRETSGVGDFVGAHPGDLSRAPTPMSENEVKRMIGPTKSDDSEVEPVSPKPKWLQEGDRVRVVDGTFNGMDGMVKHILESVSKVQVELTIFGRPVGVDLEYYQVEQL